VRHRRGAFLTDLPRFGKLGNTVVLPEPEVGGHCFTNCSQQCQVGDPGCDRVPEHHLRGHRGDPEVERVGNVADQGGRQAETGADGTAGVDHRDRGPGAYQAGQRAVGGEGEVGQRRQQSVELTHPVVGTVTVRDQKPLGLHNLKLTDGTVEGFLELLNTRVFMWTSPERLERLLGAKPYRNSIHDVLDLDTESIVESYAGNIRLTGMNTGATIFPSAPPRGAESFMTISDFPFAQRRRARKLADTVVELCVIDGVDNIEDHVVRVERRKGADVMETVYER